MLSGCAVWMSSYRSSAAANAPMRRLQEATISFHFTSPGWISLARSK